MSRITSPKVARLAAKGIQHPDDLTDDEVKALAASALVQAEHEASPVVTEAKEQTMSKDQMSIEETEARAKGDYSHERERIEEARRTGKALDVEPSSQAFPATGAAQPSTVCEEDEKETRTKAKRGE